MTTSTARNGRQVQPPDWEDLVGKFFHTFCVGRRVSKQGHVLACLGEGYHMVQLFEWVSGHPSFTGTQLIHMSRMAAEQWAWYASAEAMNEAYRYGALEHHPGEPCPCRGEDGPRT